VLSTGHLRYGFYPELVIEAAVERDVDLEELLAERLHAIIMNCKNDLRERVEVTIAEFAVGIPEVVGDLEKELERDFRRRHRGGSVGGFGGVERKLCRDVANN
jgi:hypothetical protein